MQIQEKKTSGEEQQVETEIIPCPACMGSWVPPFSSAPRRRGHQSYQKVKKKVEYLRTFQK